MANICCQIKLRSTSGAPAGFYPEGTRNYTIWKRFSVLVNFEVRVKDSVIIWYTRTAWSLGVCLFVAVSKRVDGGPQARWTGL